MVPNRIFRNMTKLSSVTVLGKFWFIYSVGRIQLGASICFCMVAYTYVAYIGHIRMLDLSVGQTDLYQSKNRSRALVGYT